MRRHETTQQYDIIKDYLAAYPAAGNHTLARLIYADVPAMWTSVDAVRSRVRFHRGNKGVESRKLPRVFGRPNGKPGDYSFPILPKQKTQLDWWPYKLNKPGNYLILSDIHIPYHNEEAVKLALNYGKANKVHTIVLNGDTMDFFSLSRWETDPRERDFVGELSATRAFLITLREMFPDATIIFKLGNHEERWESYLRVKSPELLGVNDFELSTILRFKELDIKLVKDMKIIRIGSLNVIHGHEYRKAISNPVNPARGLFLKAGCHTLEGHFHQGSYHQGTTIEGKVISCWSTGCLCELHPRYMPLNNHGHGFALVSLQGGDFDVKNLRVIKGKIF